MPASSVSQVVVVTSVETRIVGANPRRKRLVMTPATVAVCWFRPDPQGNTIGGLATLISGVPISLTLEEHGDIVKGEWYAFTTGAGTLMVGVLETID